MSLQATIRGAIGGIAALIPELTVTIISNGQTATALNCKTDYAESFESLGERGTTRGRLILDASKLTTPEKGSTILVDGKTAIVGDVVLDSVSGHLTISYQLSTPNSDPV